MDTKIVDIGEAVILHIPMMEFENLPGDKIQIDERAKYILEKYYRPHSYDIIKEPK